MIGAILADEAPEPSGGSSASVLILVVVIAVVALAVYRCSGLGAAAGNRPSET
jgi:hypothetical protein